MACFANYYNKGTCKRRTRNSKRSFYATKNKSSFQNQFRHHQAKKKNCHRDERTKARRNRELGNINYHAYRLKWPPCISISIKPCLMNLYHYYMYTQGGGTCPTFNQSMFIHLNMWKINYALDVSPLHLKSKAKQHMYIFIIGNQLELVLTITKWKNCIPTWWTRRRSQYKIATKFYSRFS